LMRLPIGNFTDTPKETYRNALKDVLIEKKIRPCTARLDRPRRKDASKICLFRERLRQCDEFLTAHDRSNPLGRHIQNINKVANANEDFTGPVKKDCLFDSKLGRRIPEYNRRVLLVPDDEVAAQSHSNRKS